MNQHEVESGLFASRRWQTPSRSDHAQSLKHSSSFWDWSHPKSSKLVYQY